MKNVPIEIIYGVLATAGGMARYLSGYKKQNGRFAFGAFFVASFISGFSGYMFALMGISMSMPQPMVFMMAGMGGFMGENALRFLAEYLMNKFNIK